MNNILVSIIKRETLNWLMMVIFLIHTALTLVVVTLFLRLRTSFSLCRVCILFHIISALQDWNFEITSRLFPWLSGTLLTIFEWKMLFIINLIKAVNSFISVWVRLDVSSRPRKRAYLLNQGTSALIVITCSLLVLDRDHVVETVPACITRSLAWVDRWSGKWFVSLRWF